MDSNSSFYILLTVQLVAVFTSVVSPMLAGCITFLTGIRRSSCLGGQIERSKSVMDLKNLESSNFDQLGNQLKDVLVALKNAQELERRA